jgi:hypothetical protein
MIGKNKDLTKKELVFFQLSNDRVSFKFFFNLHKHTTYTQHFRKENYA